MTPLLQVRDLRLGFYGVPVLNGVDIDIAEGSITGLIGPNGAGKSTFFNCLSALHPPQSGSVRFAGEDLSRATVQTRVAKGLVRTFQLARGFPKLTVFQHLMLYGQGHPGEGLLASLIGSARGRRREEELAEQALTIARRLRLTAVLDNPVTALSGGQKKLVEIGRALMARPRLILLDEPMAGVNPTLTAEIAGHLRALNAEGVTICLIEHDMKLIGSLCDPVIVMAEGRKLTEGRFADVVVDTRVQDAYLGGRH
jgi:ABC-type branched-subunit amino acid transport system ATPase component